MIVARRRGRRRLAAEICDQAATDHRKDKATPLRFEIELSHLYVPYRLIEKLFRILFQVDVFIGSGPAACNTGMSSLLGASDGEGLPASKVWYSCSRSDANKGLNSASATSDASIGSSFDLIGLNTSPSRCVKVFVFEGILDVGSPLGTGGSTGTFSNERSSNGVGTCSTSDAGGTAVGFKSG